MEEVRESDIEEVWPDRPEEGLVGPPLKGIEVGGWKVTDEEIDRVIQKLEEGWGF